jgi:MauM/NapG family ferredoxin protein
MFNNFKKLSTIRFLFSTGMFILFLWLLLKANYASLTAGSLPVNLFLKIDSFAVFTMFIAQRSFEIGLFAIALLLILLTMFFGRFFCSWVCPLGYLNQLVSRVRFNKKTPDFSRMQNFKYYFLAFLVILAIAGYNFAALFDPIALLTRTMTLSIFPAGAFLMNSFLDFTYETPVLMHSYDFFKGVHDLLFYNDNYLFQYSSVTGVILIVILGLNLLRNRFWCTMICPLGAMLGILSKFSLFKISQNTEACTGCKLCSTNCHGNADPHIADQLKYSECMVCGNCLDYCPQGGLAYSFAPGIMKQSLKHDRRAFIITAAASVIAIPAIMSGSSKAKTNLIRPPGSIEENAFLKSCIRCGECAKVCPNNAIHLTLTEGGMEGIYTPYLIPRLGYCEYQCNLCSTVCPTGAIKYLKLEQKQKIAIGKAKFDHQICQVFRDNQWCYVCEEHCPVPDKAIKIVYTASHQEIGRPKIEEDLCIGCGICEYVCPMIPEAGIRVIAKNTDRL